MYTIQGIKQNDYNQLNQMYYDFYSSIYGDFFKNLPKLLRNIFDSNKVYAEYAVKEAFSETAPKGMPTKDVLGLYKDDDLIGFVCVGIFEDLTGGIYHIYIKPDCRKIIIDNSMQRTSYYLMEGIEKYFDKYNIKNVEIEIPHQLLGIKKMAEKYGFFPQQNYSDATKYIKRR